MKVQTPHSGIEVEFCVLADEKPLQEFMLTSRPTYNTEQLPLKECFVPVQTAQKITLIGYVTRRLTHARFDLLIDGSYAGTRLVEPGPNGASKQHSRRRIDFKSAQTLIKEYHMGKIVERIVEANLKTKNMLKMHSDSSNIAEDGRAFGPGSIVVIVSLTEAFGDTQTHPRDKDEYPDCEFYKWTSRPDEIYDPGVPPTHSMELSDIKAELTVQRASTFKTRFKEPRCGNSAFAKLAFYYREKSTLLHAGCIPLPGRAYLVDQAREELPPIVSPPRKPELADRVPATDSRRLSRPLTFDQFAKNVEANRQQRQAQDRAEQKPAQQASDDVSEMMEVSDDDDDDEAAFQQHRRTLDPARMHRLSPESEDAVELPLPTLEQVRKILGRHGMSLSDFLHEVFPQVPAEHPDREDVITSLLKHIKPAAEKIISKSGHAIIMPVGAISQRKRPVVTQVGATPSKKLKVVYRTQQGNAEQVQADRATSQQASSIYHPHLTADLSAYPSTQTGQPAMHDIARLDEQLQSPALSVSGDVAWSFGAIDPNLDDF